MDTVSAVTGAAPAQPDMAAGERLSPADDIASLRTFADTAAFDYVDVSAAEAHRDALARWPLLADLDAWWQARHAGHGQEEPGR